VLEVIKPSEIKVRAVTGDEARPVNADAFPLMRDAERLETRGEDGFKSVRIGEVFQDLCLATMPLLTPPVGGGAALLDIKDLVDDSPATFEEWAGAVFKLSDAAIMQSHTGLSLDGLANWTQLLRSVLTSNYLAPALVVGVLPTREHLTDWLFETWPQLTEMEGLAHFSVRFGVAYVRGPVTPALFSTVPSAIRDNLIAYLLTWEDRPAPGILLPRNAPELEQFRTDFDIARGAVQLVVRTRADVVGPLPGYPMHFMYVNLEGLPTPLLEAWQDIDTRLTENFVIDIATGVNHPAGLASNLRRTIASYILWSYMLSDDDIRLAFLDALKNDMLLGTIILPPTLNPCLSKSIILSDLRHN
jgi:hypothetical protein